MPSSDPIQRPSRIRAPFFIVGTGRCGSTLLQAMLISHSRIQIPPETHFFVHFDPALEFADPLPEGADAAYVERCRSQPLWNELGLDADALADVLRSGCRDAAGLFGWWLGQLLGPRALADSHGGRLRLGDKTPRHEQNVARIASLFPDSLFIHIHRDPRDVVASILGMDWRSSDSLARVAKECRRTYRRQSRFERELGPERYLRVGFESLVDAPERELSRICEFLGEAFEPGMLDYAGRDDPGYLESESNWKGLTRQPLDRTRIGRHRTLLRPKEIRHIERLLEDELDHLGYARTPTPLARPDWWWANWRDARKRSQKIERAQNGKRTKKRDKNRSSNPIRS